MSEPTETETTMLAPTAEAPKKWSREEIRNHIFTQKATGKPLTLFGAPIVLKEPPMQVVMDLQANQDRKAQTSQMLVMFVFTEDGEQVFDESDADAIMELPFGKDMRKLVDEIQALLGVAPTPEAKSGTEE